MPAFLSLFGFIFKDWRMVLALVLIMVISVVAWKFHSLNGDLTHAQEALKIEQTNNQTLRNNLTEAGRINDENAKVIEAAEADKKRALEAVSQLNTDLKKTNQSIDVIKQKISGIATPPSKLTTYLVEAVKGVQEIRDTENPPLPPKEVK